MKICIPKEMRYLKLRISANI